MMSHFGAWSFGEAPKELLPDIQLGGFPLPAGSPHKAPVIYSAYTAKGIWITPNGAAKMDAVKKFIQFFYKPEMIARFVEQAGMTPPMKDVPVDQAKLNPLFVQSLTLPVKSPRRRTFSCRPKSNRTLRKFPRKHLPLAQQLKRSSLT